LFSLSFSFLLVASREARETFLFDDGFHASRDSVPLPPLGIGRRPLEELPRPFLLIASLMNSQKPILVVSLLRSKNNCPYGAKMRFFLPVLVYFINMHFFYVNFVLRNKA
jgi:hypothetical protein